MARHIKHAASLQGLDQHKTCHAYSNSTNQRQIYNYTRKIPAFSAIQSIPFMSFELYAEFCFEKLGHNVECTQSINHLKGLFDPV